MPFYLMPFLIGYRQTNDLLTGEPNIDNAIDNAGSRYL